MSQILPVRAEGEQRRNSPPPIRPPLHPMRGRRIPSTPGAKHRKNLNPATALRESKNVTPTAPESPHYRPGNRRRIRHPKAPPFHTAITLKSASQTRRQSLPDRALNRSEDRRPNPRHKAPRIAAQNGWGERAGIGSQSATGSAGRRPRASAARRSSESESNRRDRNGKGRATPRRGPCDGNHS